MPISQDLFMAILAMDSYNRGYEAGIGDGQNVVNGVDEDGLGAEGSQIGNAVVIQQDISEAAEAAGFYAVAYQWNGETVISYRGTDNLGLEGAWSDVSSGDIWNGYLTGLGYSATPQAHLAADFYQAVTGTTDADPSLSDVTVTGHSLGGGLAGFVAALYGQQAYIYDNMAFEAAAEEAYDRASSWVPGTIISNSIEEAIWGDFYNELSPWSPEIGENINAYAVTGEFLHANRLLQSTTVQSIDSNGGARDPVNQLHSQALLVSLMYAENRHTSWTSIGGELWDAAFSADVGLAAGFTISGPDGRYDAAAKLLTAIAYSSLDSGEAGESSTYTHVFGNTGIRAMFNDADELGGIVSAGKDSQVLRSALPDLSKTLVQFAGLMANREVNYHDYANQQANLYQPENGILRLADSDGNATVDAASAETLSIVLDQALWGLEKGAGEADFIEIAGFEDMLDRVFKELTTNEPAHELVTQAIRQLYVDLADQGPGDIQAAISEIQYSLSNTALDLVLGSAASAYDANHAAIFAGTDQADVITGSSANNIIAGSNGDDTLTGGLGKDILLGGIGSDTFIDSVTERDADDGRQNERDIYIGSKQNIGALTDFLQWLITGDETDTVQYTVDAMIEDDPLTPEDESTLQQEGISITDLKLGGVETIEITVQDLKSGIEGTDTLVGIEKVELSVRPDTFIVTEDALAAPIIIQF